MNDSSFSLSKAKNSTLSEYGRLEINTRLIPILCTRGVRELPVRPRHPWYRTLQWSRGTCCVWARDRAVIINAYTPLQPNTEHSFKLFAGLCTPTFEWYQQVPAHSLRAVERHSGKGRESLTRGEADEKVGTASWWQRHCTSRTDDITVSKYEGKAPSLKILARHRAIEALFLMIFSSELSASLKAEQRMSRSDSSSQLTGVFISLAVSELNVLSPIWWRRRWIVCSLTIHHGCLMSQR